MLFEDSIRVLVHSVAKLFEGFKHIENGLVVIDLERGLTDAIKIEFPSFHICALQRVDAFTRR